ncbi:6,7-dimethyl-8-ribityllumazine synthase [Candidatus Providencia siddallii]|uniref:6,7-dimethyl-8-ribityllumazine synthase n=1 Tax=Candidatus Providencia siddallii TaxID=1715285 RepID=A0A0M6W9A1_9GAMM|nr:6,7-dimethyl-8-ribityllumazine synthase [Candidatus Providencia siddallii]
MNLIKCSVVSPEANIVIVVARFNNFINDKLLEGSVDVLKRIGQVSENKITVVWIPGAYELPLITKILIESKKYDGVIALGTIIRGNTDHYEYIANECSSGLTRVSMNSNIPVSFGVLTTDSIEQAIERAGTKYGNKGAEAALTVLEIINIIKMIKK